MQQTTPTTPQAAKPKDPVPPAELQEGAIARMDAAALVRILTDAAAPEFQKAKACQRAGELGAKEAVPALAALLNNQHLSTYARYGLEPIPDRSADEALRAALPTLKGDLLIGVINSIGKRRDLKAFPALTKLMYGADADIARASAAALGSIGDMAAAAELRKALGRTAGTTRTAVADASLICAERLLAAGERDQALEIYTHLSTPDIPKPVRLAAMSGIVREETSPNRPR